MSGTFNIYCDESCHLERDGEGAMVLGAIWSPIERTTEIAKRLREIKVRHGLSPRLEMKWTKISPSKQDFYRDVVDYFFDDDDLHFRGLIVPDKSKLDHERFAQTHNIWYYKMYFEMLQIILETRSRYYIYLDIKDTNGGANVAKLTEVLRNNMRDFEQQVLRRVQQVRAREVEQVQLADVLIGAVSYANRGKDRSSEGSAAKRGIVGRVRERTKYSLTTSTLLGERKFNLFRWEPR
jgi:hypothetical protein